MLIPSHKYYQLGRLLIKGLACFFLVLGTSSFTISDSHAVEAKLGDDEDNKQLVTLHSDHFDAFVNRIYRQLTYPDGLDTIPERVFEHAMRGYMYLRHTDALASTKYLSIIDFSQYCNDRRFWIVDVESKKVVFNEWVAHGKKSGDTYAKFFSNGHSSHKSSLGFYTTGGLYYGRNNLSLKLNGLEKGFNSNAFGRGIVIHGANYVSEEIVNRKERIGRSFGCPAVSEKVNKKLINTIKGGNCLFIFHTTPSYLERSAIMNANLYITVEDLTI